MPRTGICTDVTCSKELTELYECHCCSWLICLKHLLEHVEVSQRDKQIKLDSLRNELVSISYTLELLVDKKVHEIESEKQLINQAKTILDKSGCTMEEIQLVSEEINQAIVANRKEETIVKVESSLTDIKTCTCNTDTMMLTNLYSSSSSNHILQQPQSPTYLSLRTRINVPGDSSTPKSTGNDLPTKIHNIFNINSSNEENMDPTMVESLPDNREYAIKRKNILRQCPLTFDGAFGLTKEKHSLQLCPVDNTVRRSLVGHFIKKHKIKKSYAHRLYQAVQHNQDPKTKKLFKENEDVIEREHHVSCPFNSNMIHLIGRCPAQSRNVPCQLKSIRSLSLVLHLVKRHNLSTQAAREVAENYREKLSRMISSNDNDNLSH